MIWGPRRALEDAAGGLLLLGVIAIVALPGVWFLLTSRGCR